MRPPLRVLLIEDNPADAELLVRHLRNADYDLVSKRVETLADMRNEVATATWDVVLSDHAMPGFKSVDALEVLRSVDPSTPFIIVSGAIGEQEVVDALHRGVTSYVGKDSLSRLHPTIERALHDVELRHQHDATQRRLEIVQAAVDSANDVIFVLEARGTDPPHIVYVNEAVERLTGYPSSDFVGKSTAALRSAVIDKDSGQRLFAAVSKSEPATVESLVRRRDGSTRFFETSIYPVPDSNRFVSVSRDITERKSAEQQLAFLARHDALTGLPNRASLVDRLDAAVTQARASGGALAVLFIDLDGLKSVNDALGHATGDDVLREAARRMRACLHGGDTVARVGGDEFVAVVTSASGRQQLTEIAARLRDAIGLIGRHQMSASIGISSYTTDGDSAESLLRNADAALYHVKELGGRDFCFYSPELNRRSHRAGAIS